MLVDRHALKLLFAVLGWNALVLILLVLVGFGLVRVSDRLLIAALVSTTVVMYGLLFYLRRRNRKKRA